MLNRHRDAPNRSLVLLLSGVLLLAATTTALCADDVPDPTPASAPIVYGSSTTAFPAVGLLFYPGVECTVSLIGCRTILTAAHCFCYDFESDPPRSLSPQECEDRLAERGLGTLRVYFQHGGIYGLDEVTFHPDWRRSGLADLAIARLDRPVTGIRPVGVLRDGPLPVGSTGTVVGFGRTEATAADQAIKRSGSVVTGPCPGTEGDPVICWSVDEPPGPDGGNAGLCFNDSGGPLLVDTPNGPVVAGVSLAISSSSCLAPSTSLDADISARVDWIDQTAGKDLGVASCGTLPFAFEDGTRVEGFTGELSSEVPNHELTFEVPPEAHWERVALNVAGPVDESSRGVELYVRRNAPPEPDSAYDCADTGLLGVKLCEIPQPTAGTWHALVRRTPGTPASAGSVELQLVATRSDRGAGASPAAPDGPWLQSPGLPGFEAKARFVPVGGVPIAANPESECIPESLCLSGALPGRPELFVKVIGPRPNGYLWTQISRFTPSRVEVWLRRTATGATRYYTLGPVDAASDDVPGLQDRTAFPE